MTDSSSQPPQPPLAYGHGMQQKRGNGAAVASLVLGLLGCVPIVTGVLAIVLGISGIRKSRDPSVGQGGLAVAGLVLGIISVVAWSGAGGLLGYGYVESGPAGVAAKQFLQDVSAGNINAAVANTGGFTAAQIQSQSSQMAAFGALQQVSISSFNASWMNGQTTMHLGGTATFANGVKTCTFDLVKTGGGYKVTSYYLQ